MPRRATAAHDATRHDAAPRTCIACASFVPDEALSPGGEPTSGECYFVADDPATEPPAPWPKVSAGYTCRFWERFEGADAVQQP